MSVASVRGTFGIGFAVALFVALSSCLACVPHCHGQDIVALDATEPAPFTGMLIPDDELIAWRREIERLRFELLLLQQRADAMRVADAALSAAHVAAGTERLELRERLWTERATELTRERNAARARQGPRWWQRGSLWLPVGLVVGLIAGVVAGSR